ncbi:hypothetical protein PybrP1_004011 [[Pythium] brassicae (nom. inval.)]|nr:hypothetical protein PybrP1_004011 [[Pythium] brassicae (nom. inval.)]
MVSVVQIALATATALATLFSGQADAYAVGSYFRPTGKVVSAVAGNTAKYRRSPCPALNALANHGYIARNGQNISLTELTDAIMSVFNVGADLAAALTSQSPGFPLNLDVLSTHNLIEHDASLVHSDAHFGNPPDKVNSTLVADLLQRADAKGFIGLEAVGKTRKDRLAACKRDNPECSFTPFQTRTALAEAGALICLMGAKRNNDSISVAHARSFLVHEKLPSDFLKSETQVTLVDLQTYSAKIAAFTV